MTWDEKNDNLYNESDKPLDKTDRFRKEFVDKVLDLMQRGQMFWQRPWDTSITMPLNAVTKKAYKGCNIDFLWVASVLNGYADPRWVTYKQAQENGWQVRKGEKGTTIEYWNSIQQDEDPNKQPDEISSRELSRKTFCKHYSVFNAAQVKGIPPLERPNKKDFVPHDRAESIMANCGVPIYYGGGRACYIPSLDVINLPVRECFFDEPHFYATALHEIAHSTGHPTRLNRDMTGSKNPQSYAREELRAEMACAFIQMDLGFSLTEEGMKEHCDKHAAYLQSWFADLKNDFKEFFKATKEAKKIADYVIAYDQNRSKEQIYVSGAMSQPKKPMVARPPESVINYLLKTRQR